MYVYAGHRELHQFIPERCRSIQLGVVSAQRYVATANAQINTHRIWANATVQFLVEIRDRYNADRIAEKCFRKTVVTTK